MGKAKYFLLGEALPDKDEFDLTSSWIESIIGQPLPDSYFTNNGAFNKTSPLGKILFRNGYFVPTSEIDKDSRSFKIHVMRIGKEYKKPAKSSASSSSGKNGKFNSDLDLSKIELNKNGYVKITKKNAIEIKKMVENHIHYSYVRFIKKVLKNTKPSSNRQPEVEDVITRLVVIDNIDGTNLSRNFGAGGYELVAKSIVEQKLEDYIRTKQVIPNKVFRAIAQRKLFNSEKDGVKLFSVISKYISRTSQYVYDNNVGYPIYDEVLRNYLHIYIPEMTPDLVKKYKDDLDYESYVKGINNFLKKKNENKKESDKEYITNSDFDQIVWFSYKEANAGQKNR